MATPEKIKQLQTDLDLIEMERVNPGTTPKRQAVIAQERSAILKTIDTKKNLIRETKEGRYKKQLLNIDA